MAEKKTPEQIAKIKLYHSQGMSNPKIAHLTGVSVKTVFRILNPVQKVSGELFNVDGMCWITGFYLSKWDHYRHEK